MKYLGIHKLVWGMLVIIFTAVDLAMWLLGIFIYMLWYLKAPDSGAWERFHRCENPWDNSWDGTTYSDKNIWETIKRRYRSINIDEF